MMNQSHDSLRDDFEVSCPQLNAIVEAAQAQPGCHGARMTGAGFGGCAVALIEADRAATFTPAVARRYEQSTGLKPALYVCQATDGAAVIDDKK
jgi:galactokinase